MYNYNEKDYEIYSNRFAGCFDDASKTAATLAAFILSGEAGKDLTEDQANEIMFRLDYCLVVGGLNRIEEEADSKNDHWLKRACELFRKEVGLKKEKPDEN